MPQLDFHWFASQLFWLTITFIALYLIMARITLPHIGKVIGTRHEKIGAELAKADALKKDAESLEREYMLALEKAHSSANKIISEVDKTRISEAGQKQLELDKFLQDQLQSAEKRIKAGKEKALSEMHGHQVRIAGQILKKIANIDIDEKKISNVIANLSKELN